MLTCIPSGWLFIYGMYLILFLRATAYML